MGFDHERLAWLQHGRKPGKLRLERPKPDHGRALHALERTLDLILSAMGSHERV